MKIKKVDDKPMVIHTKKKAKLHTHEPKKGKRSKNARTLDMYVRLREGKIIYIAEGGLVMKGLEKSVMTNSEILAVSKILLESHAFTKKELNGILNKLIDRCVPQQNMKIVSDLIANEKYHYVELHHKTSILDKIWKLGENIREQDILEIKYQKPETDEQPKKEEKTRIIEPVGILFSEYYFYLIAYVDVPDQNKYVHKYDYPAIFRIDRLSCIRRTEEKFRIPTAKITRQEETGTVFEAEVYGKGIIMWLLSQRDQIEVLDPVHIRTEIKEIISDMLARYQENPDT